MAKEKQKKTCDVCGGTGQVSFFQGVSRFLLTTEECSACAGTGYQLETAEEKKGENPGAVHTKTKKKGDNA